MTVFQLHLLTATLLKDGHGDKIMMQCYDANYGSTIIGEGKMIITDNCIELLEEGYDTIPE